MPEAPIPPGGSCDIPAVFKAVADQREQKQVGFSVQTDSRDCPPVAYALRATLYPEWESQLLAGSSTKLPVGGSGRQEVRITCARIAGEVTACPSAVAIDSPLTARFLGEFREQTEPDKATLIVRDVEIALPASPDVGPHTAVIRFRCPDGRERKQTVVWEVVSPLRASPSKLILRQTDRNVSHRVSISSFDGRAFRIRGVEPAHMVSKCEFSPDASRTQTVEVQIDPDRVARQKGSEVIIETDRDDQPTVSLKVIVLPAGV